MKKISKAAMGRLVRSEFFHEVEAVVKAWDWYLQKNDKPCADEMMHKWFMAKPALKFITGETYAFSRDGNGNYYVVNEKDTGDRIIDGFNNYQSS
jgi:hypothetical protein